LVDEEQYRRTYFGIIDNPCPYEKAILTRTCRCSKAARTNIAEREAVNCLDQAACGRCKALLGLTRDKANFVLGLTRTPGNLPHAKNIKIQCGGLLGLQQSIDPGSEVEDIFSLLERACAEYGELAKFPFTAMIKAVNDYQGRQRSKRQRRD